MALTLKKVQGSPGSKLSRSVLYDRDCRLFVVYMVYEDIYEGYPDWFYMVELLDLEVSRLSPADAAAYMGITDEVFEKDVEGEPFAEEPILDLEEMFDSVIVRRI